MKFWIKTSFWQNVKNTLALLGAPGGIVIAQWQDDLFWLILTGVCAFLSGAISIWFVDKNNNDVVDLFEKDK